MMGIASVTTEGKGIPKPEEAGLEEREREREEKEERRSRGRARKRGRRKKDQKEKRGQEAEAQGGRSGAVDHHLVFRYQRCGYDQKLGHLFADVTLQLYDGAVLRVIDERAVGFECLLEVLQNLLEIHGQNPACLREPHLLWEPLDRRPRLPAVALLHADVHLGAAVVLAAEAARGVELLGDRRHRAPRVWRCRAERAQGSRAWGTRIGGRET
mmetsp:Transcript_44592/g.127738  ORF Transcript_44592/g.127738 Transcript_44592/m.127738 type:complete len:213 (-) Transcript_44592:28-666(-)